MVQLVKANLLDITAMQALVVQEIKDGIILERSDDEVSTNIRSYVLAKDGDKVVGYGALHIHSPRLAEIRSLIVSSEYRGQNIGKRIVEFTLEEAKCLSVSEEVLVLTYLPNFFKKLGFIEIPKESIPEHKIWTDCIKCIHFPVCNEVSLVYKLG
ncbi:MAG: acetyltransferase [Sulfurovum sp. FS06-10]|jgi:amino-acid N-acetyltransferase|nr:MAG: acetyltransferase [Sulfurovum sp. FS06-10]